MVRNKGTRNKDFKGLQITYPASGFQSDTVKLLQRFVTTKSIRFEEFIRVWKASNFTLIYLGRSGIREKREFVEEAFKILLKYVMPPYNLQVRVGSVYMLYSVYYTQPLKCKRRIRIPLSCWPNFCELQKEINEQRHLDAAFIIRKLLADRAFMLCAYPSSLSVDEVYLHEGSDTSSSSDVFAQSGLGEKGGILSEVYDDDNIGQLHAVHEKYHQLKCKYNALSGGPSDSPGQSLSLIKPDIAKSIVDILNPVRPPTEQTRSGNIDFNHSSDRAKRIKSLKEGALTSKVNLALQPHRYRSKILEKAESHPVTESGFIVRKRGRPSSKAPDISKILTACSSGDDGEGNSQEAASNKRSQKKTKRASSAQQDGDYLPIIDFDMTKSPTRQQPKRQKTTRSYASEEGSSLLSFSPYVGTSSQSSKKTLQSEICRKLKEMTPGTFIAIRPDEEYAVDPVIAEVLAVKNWNQIKVTIYKGKFGGTWVPVTSTKNGAPDEEAAIDGDSVILSGFSLTKARKLPNHVKANFKKILEQAS